MEQISENKACNIANTMSEAKIADCFHIKNN